MKSIVFICIFCCLSFLSIGQTDFIQIETNKTLGLFSFLETCSGQQGTSSSLRTFVKEAYGKDKKFNQIVDAYANLTLEYSSRREEYPEKRTSYLTTKNLLWVAASNASDIGDFSNRIIGILPHQTHSRLIKSLNDVASYYDDLIWNEEQENIQRMERQLSDYKIQIKDLYLKISTFYNTSWNEDIPFKIALYPIPLEKGSTTAIPKGNALICGFMSHRENDYKGRLGVIIHEMCHILYNEQTPEFQHKIDTWFSNSNSPYASLAYSFFDEGLATVLGNGWAYREINKKLDGNPWYNNTYIDGFAHALLPLTDQYMNEEKEIDKEYVNKAIQLFAETFPKATSDTAILMNSVQLFANTEVEKELDVLANGIHKHFNIRSMWLSTPILDSRSIESFERRETTKLFMVHSDNINTIKGLDSNFPQLKIETPQNTLEAFKDESSKSTLIVINIDGLENLDIVYATLADIKYLENGRRYKIKF